MTNFLKLKCIGCEKEYYPEQELVLSCKNKTKNIYHILENNINISEEDIHNILLGWKENQKEVNPFIKFKDFFLINQIAKFHKINLDDIVLEIDNKLKKIHEPTFKITPLLLCDYENFKLIIKNETQNVAGSHKARHLMGNILYINTLLNAQVIKNKPKLAIYSCGNAALGAAAIANTANYNLSVFIPPNINKNIYEKLVKYNANVIECPRLNNEIGDPCYNRFQETIKKGYLPFSCSGIDNWPNIEGGETLTLEIVSQCLEKKLDIDSIFIQVGGGALASSVINVLDILSTKKIIKLPQIYIIQTESCFPLIRAYLLLIKEISIKCNLKCSFNIKSTNTNLNILDYMNNYIDEIEKIAIFIKNNFYSNEIKNILKNAIKHVNNYMWPWEYTPISLANGILDDVTYDWYKIIIGLFKSGGFPICISENDIENANKIARNLTNINVDYTGSSGFAGFLKLKNSNFLKPKTTSTVIFTGVNR